MKKQTRKKVIRRRVISIETAMMLMLNGFAIGMLVEKIAINGISWVSTTGLLG